MSDKALNKVEVFVAEMTWGGVPVDTNFVRESSLFKEKMKEFKSGALDAWLDK